MPNRLLNIPIRVSSVTRNIQPYYKYLKYPDIPYSINDIYVSTISGDRLDLLANQFYKDVDLWWIIATANHDIIRRDSFILEEGLEIRIPINTSQIISDYNKLNKIK